MPRVWNRKKDTAIPEDAVYVGRPTKWGNPFHLSTKNSRHDVIRMYTRWILAPEQSELYNSVRTELRGKDLVCYCTPKACHADILLEIANT